MTKTELLTALRFGARVAEDEVDDLARYFVETDQWKRLYSGEIDVVKGPKGSGKSALYALMATRTDDLFDRRILLVPAENPRGATVFSDLVADPPPNERAFIRLWKLYFISLVAQKIRDFDLGRKYPAPINRRARRSRNSSAVGFAFRSFQGCKKLHNEAAFRENR